jgi:16S rRNA (cytosine1402-N4)-methyltransferase
MSVFEHVPVMAKESVELLCPFPKATMIDATLGGGGHAKAILEAEKTVKLIGFDQDNEAIEAANENLKPYAGRFEIVKDNFANLRSIIETKKLKVNGILFDLGVSSHQLNTPGRGFSFQENAQLDMRMDSTRGETAADALNSLPQDELERIIRDYGEDIFFRRIAGGIIKARPLSTTTQLVDVIKRSIPKGNYENMIKSLARVFQAFRIYVNKELEVLEKALNDSISLIQPGGRIVVISYHSLEDRIVKETFKKASIDCICPPKQPVCTCTHKRTLKILTKKPLTPSQEEISVNSRARSAKLRAAEKL